MNGAPLPLTGACQCGTVRYACSAPPLRVYVCHCTECRRQSASAFGISVQVPADAFALTAGEPLRWSRPTASGGTLDCHYCGACGVRLWHRARGAGATLNIKGGTLDVALDLHGAIHIWTRSALPGVVLPPDALRFPQEPG